MKRCFIFALMVLVSVGAGVAHAGSHTRMSVEQSKQFLATSEAPVALLDVRTPTEYVSGHIGGSLLYNFNGDDFARKLSLLPRHITYVIYSHKSSRSHRTAKMMKRMNFNVIHMDGGFTEWKRNGYPTVK